MAFILSQIWVVSATSGVPNAYAYPPYWRIFRDNAFGNYRDVIKAVTLSPAMGRYLNMANNNKANPTRGTAANENYGRELMQLFTLGLTQLNPDGSPVLDANQHPVATYTLYPQLSPALAAFYDATQELGMAQNVTTFTESDFSRTFQPTTTDGSDHAWGSHHLVMGERCKAARSSAAFRPSCWAVPTIPMFAAAGFPLFRSINTARRCAPGSAYQLPRWPRCSPT